MSDNTEKIYIAKVEEVIGKTGKNFLFCQQSQSGNATLADQKVS